nr:hypothetical protein [Thiolinea sp.]
MPFYSSAQKTLDAYAKDRGITEATIRQYHVVFRSMNRFIHQVDFEHIQREHIIRWRDGLLR